MQGDVGKLVFVFGGGFEPGQTLVSISGIDAPLVQVMDPSLLIFMVPDGATTGPITITTVNGGATLGAPEQAFGLDFQGTASATGTVRFQFTNPLPAYPATYIWKVKPRQQNGYYTTFFWGNDGAFDVYKYYGAHPYPNSPPNGSTHQWEIAVGGSDVLSDTDVVYDVWYTQAFRVWSDRAGKHLEFYWNLPDTSKVITVLASPEYGNTDPSSPVLAWGDAPWNESSEIMNGVIRSIQIYSATLSVADILTESANPLTTSAGASNIWYMNENPTPTDISDKSGAGHHPAWVGPERPLLWMGP